MAKKKNLLREKKGTSPISRQGLYSVASAYSKEAIHRLVELLRSNNENVCLGAAKAILAKTIPDLKATELTGKDGGELRIRLIRSLLHLPSSEGNVSASNKLAQGQTSLSSGGLAQESKKDKHGD